MSGAAVVVIAKEPVAGRVKTRLCPPLTHDQAAHLAMAALLDTLDAVMASSAADVVLALDGAPGPWLPAGLEVIPQRSGDLGARLAGVFDDVGGPAFVVGMDTPQLLPGDIDRGLELLAGDDCDAVMGPATDGGYWSIGLKVADRRAFAGVPMSTDETGRRQLDALGRLGLRVRLLRELLDVDHHADALAVAAGAPATRFADAVAGLGRLDGSDLP